MNGASNSRGFDPARLQRIHDVIARKYVATGAVPGTLTMIWRKGALAATQVSGVMDARRGMAMREDAIFRIYSMTKPVTAVAILMLVEAGKIALDDPVCRFIPGFAGLGIYAGGELGDFHAVDSPRDMKVVDLLRHTSGLTYGILNRTNLDAAYRKLRIAEPDQEGGLPRMVEFLAQLPLEFPPGETWNYS
ncbi:MAG: serine hydrolase domain-containing protein, partial [Rhizomicrobium sp.]